MQIYVLLILMCLIGQFVNFKKYKSIYYNLVGICLIVVSAIRYDVGTDYINTYCNVFNWISIGLDTYVEEGFALLNKVILLLHGNVQWIFACTSIFIIAAFLFTIKKNVDEKYWFIALFLFICSTVYFATMNVVRQYVAIGILIFGFELLKNKKYIKYLITVFIAMSFHSAAFIGIVYMFLYINFKNKEKILMYIFCVSLLGLVINVGNLVEKVSFILPARWTWYLTSNFFTNKNNMAILKTFFPNILFIYMYIKREKLRMNDRRFDNYFIAWFIFVIISNLFSGINVFIRLGQFFDYYIIYIIPLILDLYKGKKIQGTFCFIVILYYLFLTIYSIFISNGHGVIPYKTIFSI